MTTNTYPDARSYFGQFVAETLMQPLLQLQDACTADIRAHFDQKD